MLRNDDITEKPREVLISCHKHSSERHALPMKLEPCVSDNSVLANLKFSPLDKGSIG